MPFLDRLQRWAREQPERTAVGVGGLQLSAAELVESATAVVPAADHLTVLCGSNSVELVASFAAAVAGERCCAVLDPKWPAAQQRAVRQRLAAVPVPAAANRTVVLQDGPAASPFLVGLTSGTSAVPKGFSRSRASWQISFESSIEYFGLGQTDVTLAPGPLSASLNLYALAECLYAGAPFFTLPAFDVAAVFTTVKDQGVTRLVVVPAMLRMIAERAIRDPSVSCSGITSIVSAGAKLDAQTLALARRWAPNAVIFEYYGASEQGFLAATRLEPGVDGGPRDTAVGPAFPGVRLEIRSDQGEVLPPGEPGTIYAYSELVSNGYLWGDDALAFSRDGEWSTVGDQGFLAADGVLHFLGRRSDMMVSAGHNVYPHELELALQDVPGVGTAVAAAVPDGYRGQRIVAGVLAEDPAGPDLPGLAAAAAVPSAVLRSAAAAALPVYKRPSAYYALDELPLTPGGKISRALLADWIAGEDPRARRLS